MKLISVLEARKTVLDEVVFRTSWISSLIAFLIFFSIFLGIVVHYFWYSSQHTINIFGLFAYLCFGAMFGLISYLSFATLRSSLLKTNWLVKASPDQLLIKFRSFQNHYYSEIDLVVIELFWREIEWVRKTKETSTKPGSDGDVTSFFTHLDIKLNLGDEELGQISKAIMKEKGRRPLQSDVGKLRSELFQARKNKAPDHEIEDIKQRIKQAKMDNRRSKVSGAKHHDYPVSVEDNSILRVRWNSIRPNIKKALTYFSRFTSVEEDLKIKSDSRSILNDKELDDMIQDRIDKGDIMDAINLVRNHYGFSTTEAKRFVDELMGKSEK